MKGAPTAVMTWPQWWRAWLNPAGSRSRERSFVTGRMIPSATAASPTKSISGTISKIETLRLCKGRQERPEYVIFVTSSLPDLDVFVSDFQFFLHPLEVA